MPIVADAAVAVRGDLSRFKTDLMGADKQVQGFGARLKGALSPGKLLAGAGIALGGAQVLSFLSDSIGAASDLGETVSKTGQILGQESMPQLEAWAETAADTFGQSKRQALDAASTFAIFGKSAGLSGDDLSGFSTELTELASDLASFHNSSPEEAITAIGAALRGENEPIRRFGVLLDDASLRQEAFRQGLIKTTKQALTPQQKVLAAQALIMEQTADAQGDFARTSDGLANTQRTLAARLEDVQAKIGEKLLPAAVAFAEFVSDTLIPALEWLTDNVFGPMIEGIGNIAQAFRDAAGDVHFFAMNFGEQGDKVHAMADEMGEDFDGLKDKIRDRMVETGESFEEASEGIRIDWINARADLATTTDEMMAEILAGVKEGRKPIETEFEGTADFIPQAIKDRWDDARDAGFQQQVEYAKGLLDGQNDVKVAIEAALQIVEEEMTTQEELAYLAGQKTTLEHARGVASAEGKEASVIAIDAALGLIDSRMAELNGDAYTYGYNLGASYARGIEASANFGGVVRTAAGKLAQAVEGQIGIRSEPKDHDSPLHGITKWGGNLVKTYAEGMLGSLGTGSAAARALAGALVPSLGTPAFAGAGIGAGAGVTNQWILNVSGTEKVFSSRDDFIKALDDLGAFGEGRLG